MRILDRDEPVYMIGVAARICRVHPQTLRMYERLGLVAPQRINSKNRMYSEADIERLHQIQTLTQEMGVNLAGVEVILDLLDKMRRMREEMEQEMNHAVQEMEQRLRNAMRGR